MRLIRSAAILSVVIASPGAIAAPCCAGGASLPALITGDERGQFSASLSRGSVIGDAPNEGIPVFRGDGEAETTQTLKLAGAWLLGDRTQFGATVGLAARDFRRGTERAAATRAGDTSLGFAYEALTEWAFSHWRPRGHVFLETTFPTGRSVYEAERTGMVDATGRGFYRIALGATLTKRRGLWDAALVTEVHRSLPRTFSATDANRERLAVDAGYGVSAAAGVGYSPGGGNLRIGLRLQPAYSEGRALTASPGTPAASRSHSRPVRVVDTTLEASWLLQESSIGTWTAFASYLDQTLLGPAANTTLNRIVALGIQRRWDR